VSRKGARRTALFLLYQWDVTGQPLASLYEGEVDEWARTTAEEVAAGATELDRRIEARMTRMLAAGWIDEVQRLRHEYPTADWKRLGHGYPEIAAYLDGRVSLEAACTSTIRQVRQYARRQYTWFRADPRVTWIAAGLEEALGRLRVGMMGAEAS